MRTVTIIGLLVVLCVLALSTEAARSFSRSRARRGHASNGGGKSSSSHALSDFSRGGRPPGNPLSDVQATRPPGHHDSPRYDIWSDSSFGDRGGSREHGNLDMYKLFNPWGSRRNNWGWGQQSMFAMSDIPGGASGAPRQSNSNRQHGNLGNKGFGGFGGYGRRNSMFALSEIPGGASERTESSDSRQSANSGQSYGGNGHMMALSDATRGGSRQSAENGHSKSGSTSSYALSDRINDRKTGSRPPGHHDDFGGYNKFWADEQPEADSEWFLRNWGRPGSNSGNWFSWFSDEAETEADQFGGGSRPTGGSRPPGHHDDRSWGGSSWGGSSWGRPRSSFYSNNFWSDDETEAEQWGNMFRGWGRPGSNGGNWFSFFDDNELESDAEANAEQWGNMFRGWGRPGSNGGGWFSFFDDNEAESYQG